MIFLICLGLVRVVAFVNGVVAFQFSRVAVFCNSCSTTKRLSVNRIQGLRFRVLVGFRGRALKRTP